MENLSGAKNLSEKKARKNKQLVNSRPVGHVQNHNVGEIRGTSIVAIILKLQNSKLEHVFHGRNDSSGVNLGPGHEFGSFSRTSDAGNSERRNLGTKAVFTHNLSNGWVKTTLEIEHWKNNINKDWKFRSKSFRIKQDLHGHSDLRRWAIYHQKVLLPFWRRLDPLVWLKFYKKWPFEEFLTCEWINYGNVDVLLGENLCSLECIVESDAATENGDRITFLDKVGFANFKVVVVLVD